jgi:hypothetical protein
MTDTLRAAFHDLADAADPRAGNVPQDLWHRGRRERRLRLASTGLVVAALLGVLGATVPLVGEQARSTPAPASYDRSRLAVPDRVSAPSSWAPTAGEGEAVGPLAMVGLAPRRGAWLFPRSEQWFGVSAVDQGYRWLDLPRQAVSEEAQAVSLSPDGERLAYFLGGTPTAANPQSDVVGFAVWDLTTGEVTERRVDTRFGLRADRLVWSGDSRRLVVGVSRYARVRGASSFAEIEAWDPRTGATSAIELEHSWEQMAAAPSGVATWDERRLALVDAVRGTVSRHRVEWWWRDDSAADEPVLNADGSRVVWRDGVRRGRGTYPAVYTATLATGGEVGRPLLIEGTFTPWNVLGWLDDSRVLVEADWNRARFVEEAPRRILAIDVVTGEVGPGIGRPRTDEELHDEQLATRLLSRPLAPGEEPRWHLPLGPVVLGALGLFVLSRVAIRRARAAREERAIAGTEDA